MINELYKEYNEYVILIKSGNFYLLLNKDSFFIHFFIMLSYTILGDLNGL